MKKYLVLFFLLASLTSFGQFSNYTNINGRYKWIAGKFDSTFTLPSGTTPSLRVGGGTGPGALFYSTTDSTVYQYTGTRWTRLRGTDTAHVVSAYVRNTTASTMTAGQVVYINGSTGTTPTIALAVNTADSTSAMTFGFVRGTIAPNAFGWITSFGPLEGVNTNAYTEGEVIYLDSIPGQFTHDKPQAPYHMVTLGYIVKKSGGNGTIFAKIQNGYELDELHNVRITEPVLNKSVIIYDSVRRLWVDTTVSAAGLGLGGSGTTNYLSKWTSSSALGNSLVFDNGTSVGVNTATPSASYLLDVNGTSRTSNTFSVTGGTDAISGVNGLHIWFAGSTTANISAIQSGVSGRQLNLRGFPLTFMNSNSGGEAARLSTSNNFLINTVTDAGFRLDVSGTFRSTGDANINGLTVGKGGGSVATNTAIGVQAINGTPTGTWATANGYFALKSLTTGNGNTAIGAYAGEKTTTGGNNTFLGVFAGQYNTTASANVAIGTYAGYGVNGRDNTLVGVESGYNLSTGVENTYIGRSSGRASTTAYSNVFIGFQSGFDVTTANNNSFVGRNTGRGITTGSNNTIVGSEVTGLSASLANHTIIADGQGNMRLVAFNDGNVFIGGSTSLPTNAGYKLDVNGTARVQTSAYFATSSGAVGIGTTSPNASALLDITSTTKGFLPPRMTNAQMVAITTPAAGLVVYDTTNNKLNVYDGTNWVTLH